MDVSEGLVSEGILKKTPERGLKEWIEKYKGREE
jgi:hypothetical protein